MKQIYLDDQLLAERRFLKSQLDVMDAKIADTFMYEYRKMYDAGDDAGIMFIAGQLPDDFRHKVRLYQACIEIEDKRKKMLTSPAT
jgi:hypothetical protein